MFVSSPLAARGKGRDGVAPSPVAAKSDALFAMMAEAVKKDGAKMVKKFKGVVCFDITDGDAWTLDLKNGDGSVTKGKPKKADLTMSISDDNMVALGEGKLNAQTAFMSGKLKIKGNMGLAMKLGPIIEAARPKARL